MKTLLTLICLSLTLLLGTPPAQAQNGDKIETARVAFISNRINLTPEQAKQFWPVYNEFQAKRKGIRKSMRQVRKAIDTKTGTEAEAKANLDKFVKLREDEAALEKEYLAKFQKVITSEQVAQYLLAEQDFTKMLLKRLNNGEDVAD